MNKDLLSQSERIKSNIQEEQSKRAEAKRVLDDLTKKHNEAVKKYEALLAEVEKDKKKSETDLDTAKKTFTQQQAENQKLSSEVNSNEKTISGLVAEIT